MNCKEVKEQMIFFMEGTLPHEEYQAVEKHLESCSACAAELEFLQSAFESLDAVKATEVKPYLFTRVKARMLQQNNVERRWLLSPYALASVLVVGLMIGTLVGTLTRKTIQNSVSSEYDVAALFNDSNFEAAEFHLLKDE